MFLDRLLNDGSSPLLEQWLQFTEARQRFLAEDVANASTPNYVQKDLSLEQFQAMLRAKLKSAQSGSADTASFDDVAAAVQHPVRGILFHDGNNRSMEQLMTDQAKNGLMHMLAVELLKHQYSVMEMALKERVG
ncbi:MAG: hypothetical protein ABR964_12835 [Tepidisphaeraceae bacterium]|jgi:flagellar basal-body rod protein FlgB